MDKALDILREFAGKIGTTAEEMWPHAVRNFGWQATGALIVRGVWIVAFMVAFFVCSRLYRGNRPEQGEKWSDDASMITFIPLGAVSFAFLAFAMVMSKDLSMDIANAVEPAGGLLREILGR